jgi:hypothetical protein
MTRQKSFKRLVRARMEKTGESYTAARATLLAAAEPKFVDASARERWLPGVELRERTATRPRTVRFDWRDGATRLVVGFTAKADAKSTVALEHERLADAAEVERMKPFWRERLDALASQLERRAR